MKNDFNGNARNLGKEGEEGNQILKAIRTIY